MLEQKNDMVGTVRRIEGRLKFVPDDCPAISMTIQRDCEGGAKDGDKVAVEILQRGTRQEDHRVGVSCALALRGGQALRQGPALCQGHPHSFPREGAGRGQEVRGHDRV